MDANIARHSRAIHAFLAETHGWFEGSHCLGTEIPSRHEVQSWGLAALDLAREHSFAIRTLLDPVHQPMLASASALMRPLVEAVLRGYLFSYCGLSGGEVLQFQEGRNSYSIEPMILKIESTVPEAGRHLRPMVGGIERSLHRYTHGDVHQLSRRLSQTQDEPTSKPLNVIRPLLDERDVIGVLYVVSRLTLLTLWAIVDQSGDSQACASINHRHEELDRLLDEAGHLFEERSQVDG